MRAWKDELLRARSRSTAILSAAGRTRRGEAVGPTPKAFGADCRSIVTRQNARSTHRLAAARRLTVLGFVLICGSLPAAPFERSISPSRQFIIFGGNRILRSAVSDGAEQVKSKVLGLLQLRDQWSVPILLNLQRPQANAPEVFFLLLRFTPTSTLFPYTTLFR